MAQAALEMNADLKDLSDSQSPEVASPLQSWSDALGAERQKTYFTQLLAFIERERTLGTVIYPSNSQVFNAMHLTPYADVKVVILGQDPYHGPNQAHGLCFSVCPPTPPPPSLQNIFKELNSDLGITPPNHGSLISWAKQGVLLLNTVLTVEQSKPLSHAGIGWEKFTDRVIESLNNTQRNIVFLLWGAPAQKKQGLIAPRHHILTAPHPSPLSAHRGFLGCRHFSKANAFLREQGDTEIDWRL